MLQILWIDCETKIEKGKKIETKEDEFAKEKTLCLTKQKQSYLMLCAGNLNDNTLILA